ncbi:unnamed protein product [Closterium sp. NIES-54]
MGNCLKRGYNNGPVSSSRAHRTTDKEGTSSLEAKPRKQSSEEESSFETAQAAPKPIPSASLFPAAVAGSASSINSASAAPLPAPSAFPASAAIARPAKPDGLGSKAQDSGLVAPVLPPDLSGQPVKEKSLRVKHGLGMDGGAGDWAGKMAEAGGMSKGSVKMLPPTPMFAHLGNVRKAGSGEAHKLPRTERNGAGARSEEGDGAGSGGRSRSGSGRLWVFGGSADGSNGSRRGMGATAAAVVAGAGLVAQARDVCSMHAGRPLAMLSAGDRSTGGGGTMGGGGSMSGRGSTGGPRIKRNLTAAQISQHASALREGRTMCELLRVQQRGKGRHLLIMAHGFGANHAQWKDVVELMSPDRFTVLLFDFIGAHGWERVGEGGRGWERVGEGGRGWVGVGMSNGRTPYLPPSFPSPSRPFLFPCLSPSQHGQA